MYNFLLIKKYRGIQKERGFTLVEMIVSLGLFTIVLFLATSALLTIVNADRKSRATRIAIDNLNLTLENMARRIKTGSIYNCGGGIGTKDCSVAQSSFSFSDQTGVHTVYKRAQGTGNTASGSGCGSLYRVTQGCILRFDSTTGIFIPITSPEMDITNVSFFVSGSAPCGSVAPSKVCLTNNQQPAVAIVIDGSFGFSSVNTSAKSSFKIQTALTQRTYDN